MSSAMWGVFRWGSSTTTLVSSGSTVGLFCCLSNRLSFSPAFTSWCRRKKWRWWPRSRCCACSGPLNRDGSPNIRDTTKSNMKMYPSTVGLTIFYSNVRQNKVESRSVAGGRLALQTTDFTAGKCIEWAIYLSWGLVPKRTPMKQLVVHAFLHHGWWDLESKRRLQFTIDRISISATAMRTLPRKDRSTM